MGKTVSASWHYEGVNENIYEVPSTPSILVFFFLPKTFIT